MGETPRICGTRPPGGFLENPPSGHISETHDYRLRPGEGSSTSFPGYIPPAPQERRSGIGLISGWVCEANEVLVRITSVLYWRDSKETEFLGSKGRRIMDIPFAWHDLSAGYGTERFDTQEVCGDTDNGFSLLINWNNLVGGPLLRPPTVEEWGGPEEVRRTEEELGYPAGTFLFTDPELFRITHLVSVYADGRHLGENMIEVVALGEEFLREASGEYILEDFPEPGRSVVVEWEESLQNFVITGKSDR